MEQDNNRRSFLGKLTLSLSALFTMPAIGAFANTTSDKQKTMKNTIKQIKPLGFQWETADPFLFCVHHEDKFPKGNDEMGPATSLSGRHMGNDFIIKDGFRMYHGKKVPGFPGHPHRGFETITLVREGFVDHADSMGAAGRYGNGDVQWMTAGKGVQHSEMFPLIYKDKENPMELFQIWLNLPKKSKFAEPHFKMFWKEEVPKYRNKDAAGNEIKIEIIAGELFGIKAPAPPPASWAADPKNEVGVWNIHLKPNAQFILPKASSGINRTLYFYIGEEITIAGKAIKKYHSVEVEADVDLEIKNNNHESRILVLQGRPINEPVIQYGPFVMNTKEEIQQAFDDYHKTQFGGWPWPKLDQVHDRKSGRFAIHADGRKEVKG
jgi:redox-sensitive bicupin YhaK (pirin superfamily)